MLGSAVPSTATLHTSTSSATPSSPTRPSRIRGFSYLRNYTHNHLLPSSSSAAATTTTSPTVSRPQQPLARSASNPPESLPPARDPLPSASAPAPARERSPELNSNIHNGEHGWLPTVQGRSALSRASPHPTRTSTESAQPEPNTAWMTRSRAASVALGPTPSAATPTNRAPARRQSHTGNMTGSEGGGEGSGGGRDPLPTIRFIPHVEARAARPSLHFSAVSRTLPQASNVVRVGRYSERDNTMPGDASGTVPVGFKSKVVSRRHCEFWCAEGQWYVKDVKSSSGTFLNHVRLSSPNSESRPFPVNDGDVVQLGIDFKGGEEVIFRCVKIRVECNRGWQKSLNTYNTSAHKRILKGAKSKTKDSDAASTNSSECSICLNPVAPCQALFVAPCSHVWHYKCVRNLISGPNWPNFLCPNCRFVADLEADVEQPEDDMDFEEESLDEVNADSDSHEGAEPENGTAKPPAHPQSTLQPSNPQSNPDANPDADFLDTFTRTMSLGTPNASSPAPPTPANQTLTASTPVSINPAPASTRTRYHTRTPSSEVLAPRSATPTSNAQFALAAGVMHMGEHSGPVTPRNDAGPFVLDGQGRGSVADGLAGEVVREESEPVSREGSLRGVGG